ncbi:hypothetical protein [Streptomyces luteolus]|uniref:Uncharacterized protein n=1 Tax=Streptomyces luteolus TaxID=3043615 RepID=A0ABT6T1D3_9ACTN|nr:hypothetical protein [Streptomyces sp. B-S-A12]MDI3421665.1 hypothetical protein [Streptomyces sp. B-S-A12]
MLQHCCRTPRNLLDEDDRWPLLQRSLTDDALPTDVRDVGAIILIFGRPANGSLAD